jgi:hypothetical protein
MQMQYAAKDEREARNQVYERRLCCVFRGCCADSNSREMTR